MQRRAIDRLLVAALSVAAFAATTAAPRPELLSKRYQFKDGVVLEIALITPSGLRLETVSFQMPPTVDGRLTRAGGLLRASVVVSNTAQEPRKVGLAIALFDDEDRLLGVASGGSKLASIKPDQRKTFTLDFDGVFAEANRTATFQISLEPKN